MSTNHYEASSIYLYFLTVKSVGPETNEQHSSFRSSAEHISHSRSDLSENYFDEKKHISAIITMPSRIVCTKSMISASPRNFLYCVGLQCSKADYSSTIHLKTALVEMETSREPNFIRTWSADSWPDRPDWRLSILKSEDGIDKVCNVRDLVQAIGEGLEFVRNPNGKQLNFRSDFRYTFGFTNGKISQNIHMSQYPKYKIMSSSNSLLKKL